MFGEELQAAIIRLKFNRYPDSMATDLCRKFAQYYGVDPPAVVAGNGYRRADHREHGAFLRRRQVLTFSQEFSVQILRRDLRKEEYRSGEKGRPDPHIGDVLERGGRLRSRRRHHFQSLQPTSLVMSREDVLHIVKIRCACRHRRGLYGFFRSIHHESRRKI